MLQPRRPRLIAKVQVIVEDDNVGVRPAGPRRLAAFPQHQVCKRGLFGGGAADCGRDGVGRQPLECRIERELKEGRIVQCKADGRAATGSRERELEPRIQGIVRRPVASRPRALHPKRLAPAAARRHGRRPCGWTEASLVRGGRPSPGRRRADARGGVGQCGLRRGLLGDRAAAVQARGQHRVKHRMHRSGLVRHARREPRPPAARTRGR
mmetsp:Transcript_2775/g.9380  ORF Transcript_2775/g.9380 Transcript_2775/m.9380 type:complete len:210 (+) Transcript_2775:1086-1715(+)